MKLQFTDTARKWYKKVSTWLSGSLGGALVAYALLPSQMQNAFPDWSLLLIGALVMFVVPAAVQIKQPSLHN